MSQVANIVLKVRDIRLRSKVEETVDDVLFGFRKGKGTRNAIFKLRTFMQRAVGKQRDLNMRFLNFGKAFDMVLHELLLRRLVS